jgi:D-alanyl-D-alanine carboxypeptidase/D-alanyl-D-alanine-endopeptidase (penicillin-binding protein 4)
VFRDSLARPGQPGTLRSRRYAAATGRLWAKTGSIRGVRTLAGYAKRPDGELVTFALLVNGSARNDVRARIAELLVD